MAHSDDNGLVLPPKLAPIQVVIVPIYKSPEDLSAISEKIGLIVSGLKAAGISVKYDDSDNQRSGWKFAEYELKGVPVRLAMGMRDVENGTIEVARRDTLTKESLPFDRIVDKVRALLDEIQTNIYSRALEFRESNTYRIDNWEDFCARIELGGFVEAHWDGTSKTEEQIKEKTKATIRCIPLDAKAEHGSCILTGRPSERRVLFAKAY